MYTSYKTSHKCIIFFKKKFHIKTSDQNKTCLYKNKSTQQPFGLGAMKLM